MTGHDDLFSELAFVTYRWRSKSRVQHLAHSCARISFASGSAMWLRGVTTKNVAARENQRLYGLFLAKFRSYFFLCAKIISIIWFSFWWSRTFLASTSVADSSPPNPTNHWDIPRVTIEKKCLYWRKCPPDFLYLADLEPCILTAKKHSESEERKVAR